MKDVVSPVFSLLIIVTPSFNLATTTCFIDVFRALNYLQGTNRFNWLLASANGGEIVASNAFAVGTLPILDVQSLHFDYVVVSSSWTPERYRSPRLLAALNRWARDGAIMGALDTGAFILAEAGLLKGQTATVHYEHWDSFKEEYPDITLSEELYVLFERHFTCCGGSAATDAALHIAAALCGPPAAQAAARYIFCDRPRLPGSFQGPVPAGTAEASTSGIVQRAIAVMEQHSDVCLGIPDVGRLLDVSHRQLDRLFKRYTGKPPAQFYRDLRLDRARGLVTQTELPLSEIAVATGFGSQVHFSAAYRKRFGLPPSADRVKGRIPFELRARPVFRHRS